MNTEEKIPGIKSYTRVNPESEDDRDRALAMVPDEERIRIADFLEIAEGRQVIVLHDDETVTTRPEEVFNAAFLSGDEGLDLDAPVENGEISLFELGSDSERTDLAKWAVTVLPGVDLIALQARVRPGNLVLHRPGGISFEVYGPVDYASFERSSLKIGILHEVSGDVEKARAAAEWVFGE